MDRTYWLNRYLQARVFTTNTLFFYSVLVFQSGYECNTELSYENPVKTTRKPCLFLIRKLCQNLTRKPCQNLIRKPCQNLIRKPYKFLVTIWYTPILIQIGKPFEKNLEQGRNICHGSLSQTENTLKSIKIYQEKKKKNYKRIKDQI